MEQIIIKLNITFDQALRPGHERQKDKIVGRQVQDFEHGLWKIKNIVNFFFIFRRKNLENQLNSQLKINE